MEQKTLDMFISTCNYLKFLTEDIINSSAEIPPEVVLTVNDLMSKLFCFTNRVYKNDLKTGSSKGSISGSNSFAPMNSLQSYTNSGMSTAINLNMPSARGLPSNLYGTSITGPAQSQEKYEGMPKIVRMEPTTAFVENGSISNRKAQAVKQTKSMSTQNNTSNSKEKNSREKLGDVFITKLFSGYLDAILEGAMNPNNMGIYCHVCDTLCLKTWLDHTAEKNHTTKKMNKKKLKMYTCRICRICIYGSKHIIIKFFEFHFRKIHLDKTDLSWEESLIETECSDNNPKSSSEASSMSSLNCDSPKKSKTKAKKKKNVVPDLIVGSQNNVAYVKPSTPKPSATNYSLTTNLSAPNTKTPFIDTSEEYPSVPFAAKPVPANSVPVITATAKPKVIVPSKTSQSSAPGAMKSTLVDMKPSTLAKSLNNNSPSPKIEVNFPTSSYPDFDKVLNEMKNKYVTSALKLEVGYCTICDKCVLNAFDWYDHKETHDAEGNGWKEENCSKCGLSIFGKDHKKYLSLPGHNMLDKIMTAKS